MKDEDKREVLSLTILGLKIIFTENYLRNNSLQQYETFCANLYQSYNLKNVKKAEACKDGKSTIPQWVFFTFSKLYK